MSETVMDEASRTVTNEVTGTVMDVVLATKTNVVSGIVRFVLMLPFETRYHFLWPCSNQIDRKMKGLYDWIEL